MCDKTRQHNAHFCVANASCYAKTMGLPKNAKELTQQQRDFVRAFILHGNATLAATQAGYSHTAPHMLLRTSTIMLAIQAETRRRLFIEHAPAAVGFLARTMDDSNIPIKLRIECAKTLADRGGLVPPKASENNALEEKSENELTADELKDRIRNMQRILSDRAVEILDNAPHDAGDGGQALDPLS
jgi:phage terminase small subunit